MDDRTLRLLTKLSNHCNLTFLHSLQVASDLYGFGHYLNLKDTDHLFLLGSLHDIGTIKIDPYIFNKKGKLTTSEFNEYKQHTLYGELLLSEIPSLSAKFSEVILFHHENLDGSGFYGIKGEEIPLLSRMIRIVDAYDSLRNGYMGQAPKEHIQAIREMYSFSGIYFDEDLILSFIEYLELKSFRPPSHMTQPTDSCPVLVCC
jgi:HD-GYP domain-containing protein (c-di-GMP phosphodiesterase class II)